MYAVSSFFDVFSFSLLRGDVHTALNDPRKVILTETTARRYFGDVDPMGRQIRVGTDTMGYLAGSRCVQLLVFGIGVGGCVRGESAGGGRWGCERRRRCLGRQGVTMA